ncbi:DUF2000 domain-containing protein [Nocardiopsis sp. CNR-923]|uniref:DUF2000 domain-containing protein n=1 Tax=Nocardiopsis sp. CNR-923 TaxID=1904965 RepID=UPI0021CD10A7|nr:DUF2000 domain-containing protein [Nocardiopsis sp. CNR-923]
MPGRRPGTGRPSAAGRRGRRAATAEELSLVGVAVYGPRGQVDKTVKGLGLHP